MGLDYTIKKPGNLSEINSNDFGEVLWWSYIMCTSPEKLLTTIERVGNSTEKVREVLKVENR